MAQECDTLFLSRHQWAVLETLRKLEDPQIIPPLTPLLVDPDDMTRWCAVKTLRYLNDPQIIPLLAPLVADAAWSVRQAAMKPLRLLVKL
jgi:HEAT repeat protein